MRTFVLSKNGDDIDALLVEAEKIHNFDTEAVVLPLRESGVDLIGMYGLYVDGDERVLTELDYSVIAGEPCSGCEAGDAIEILDLDADAIWVEGDRVFHNLECVGLLQENV